MTKRRAVGGQPPPSTDTSTPPPPGNNNPLPTPAPRPRISPGQQNIVVAFSNGQRVPAIWGSNVQTGGLMLGPWIVNGNLIVDYIVSHGPIGAMTFTLGGQTPAQLGFSMNSNVYLGTASQGLDPILSSVPGWTSALPGLAHVAIKLNSPTVTGVVAPSVQSFLAQVTQGLLGREPRENLLLWSGDISKSAVWVPANGLTVAQNGVGPDGNPAWQLTDSNAAALSFCQQPITVANDSATYKFQFRVLKTTGGTAPLFEANFNFIGGTGVNNNLIFNTDTAAITTGSWTISTDPTNSAWWLCQGSLANNSTGNTTLLALFAPAANAVVTTGSATVAMAQMTKVSAITWPAYAYTSTTALAGSVDANGIPNAPRAFTGNPALIWADFKTSVRYGAGYPDAEINWCSTATKVYADVCQAANDCDYVGGALAGTKRYRMGWKLDPTQSLNADDVENAIRQHFFASIAFYNGKWNCWVNKAQAATGQIFQDHTGPGGTAGSNILSARWRQKGMSEVPTSVIVHYVDAAANFQDGQGQDDDPGLTSGANPSVQYVLFEYSLGAQTYDQAKRLAIQYRNQGLLDKEYWITVGPEGMLVTPGCVITVYSLECNVSNQPMLVIDVSYSPSSDTFILHCFLYSAAVYLDTPQTGSPTANTIAPNPNATPPNIVNLRLNSTGDLYWEPAQALTYNTYGASFWAAANVGAFTAANVNDGSIAAVAFNLNVAADSTLTFDAGVGNTIAPVTATVWYSAVGAGADFGGAVEFSDNMSSWTAVSNLAQTSTANTGRPALGGNPVDYGWVYAGGHRGWRIRKNSSIAFAVNVNEVQWAESAGPLSFIDHYLIVDLRYSTPQVLSSIPQSAIPTAARGIGLRALTKVDPTGSRTINLSVVAVTTSNAASSGITYLVVSAIAVGTLTSDSSVAFGQTAYNTGVGFWLGLVSGTAQLSLGSSSGNSLTFDGTNLSITGNISATSGTIGGWTIGATTLSAANMIIDSGNSKITANGGTIVIDGVAGSITAPTLSTRAASFTATLSCTGAGEMFLSNNLTTNGKVTTGSFIDCGTVYKVSGTQVVGARGAAVTAPIATIADCQRAINDIISRISSAAGHGLIT